MELWEDVLIEVTANQLNITPRDLWGELKDGTTIAEAAAAQNVDPQAIYDDYLVDLAARLDALVAAAHHPGGSQGAAGGRGKPQLGDCVDPRSWIRTGQMMMVVGTAASGSRRADSHIRRSRLEECSEQRVDLLDEW